MTEIGLSENLGLRKLLTKLGFSETSTGVTWTRICGPSSYKITCKVGKTLAASRIEYGPAITQGRVTTGSFAQAESAVVLDCVCRLLDQGFPPDQITLEQPYVVGHDPKYLDVLVRRDGVAYLMIECKTAGAEYDAECVRVLRDGGQVLTYYVQDRTAEWLVTYSADFAGAKPSPRYRGLSTTPFRVLS